MNDYERRLIDELESPVDLMDARYEGESGLWLEEDSYYDIFINEGR